VYEKLPVGINLILHHTNLRSIRRSRLPPIQRYRMNSSSVSHSNVWSNTSQSKASPFCIVSEAMTSLERPWRSSLSTVQSVILIHLHFPTEIFDIENMIYIRDNKRPSLAHRFRLRVSGLLTTSIARLLCCAII
jgi:hypothetical protein